MKNSNIGLLILRLTLGLLMLLHGIAKLTNGPGGIQDMIEGIGLPGFLAYGVYLGEVVAPIMLIIGFRVRIAAMLFISTMLVAVGLAHAGDILSLSQTGGWAIELQALYLFGALTLVFTGGGNLAVSQQNKWD